MSISFKRTLNAIYLLYRIYSQNGVLYELQYLGQIPLRYLVADRFEAGRRPAARAR